jgi:hypothetical protein
MKGAASPDEHRQERRHFRAGSREPLTAPETLLATLRPFTSILYGGLAKISRAPPTMR